MPLCSLPVSHSSRNLSRVCDRAALPSLEICPTLGRGTFSPVAASWPPAGLKRVFSACFPDSRSRRPCRSASAVEASVPGRSRGVRGGGRPTHRHLQGAKLESLLAAGPQGLALSNLSLVSVPCHLKAFGYLTKFENPARYRWLGDGRRRYASSVVISNRSSRSKSGVQSVPTPAAKPSSCALSLCPSCGGSLGDVPPS